MLKTPPEEDLGLILLVFLGYFQDNRMIESLGSGQWTPSFQDDMVLLANIHNIRMTHERV